MFSGFFRNPEVPVVADDTPEGLRIREINDDDDFILVINNPDQIQRLEEDLQIRNETIAKLTSERKKLKERMKALTKQHEAELKFKDKVAEQRDGKARDLDKVMKDTERALQAKITELTTKLTEIDCVAEEHRLGNTALSQESEVLSAQREADRHEISRLSKEMEELTQSHRAQVRSLQSEIMELQEEKEVLEDKLNEQERQAQEQEAVVQEFVKKQNEQLGQVGTELAKSQQQVTDLEGEVEALQSKLQSARRLRNDEKVKLEADKQDLVAENKKISAERMELEARGKKQEGQIEKANKEVQNARKKLAAKSAACDSVTQHLQDLTAQHNAEQREADLETNRLESMVGEQKLEIEKLLCDLQLAREEAAQADEEKNTMQTKLDATTVRLSTIQKEVDALQRQLESAAKEDMTKQQAEVKRILESNPGCVAIRCIRAAECTYPLLPKKKFAAPSTLDLSRFNEYIRGKLALKPSDPLSVYVASDLPQPESESLKDLFDNCKNADGFLHLKYTQVSE
eukprot:NODE_301_length_1824_cov_192.111549_g243_i0.p1 GENE.NODE_301_length_1824_cov_192.111549_g243_i0~~NODE_301_length_1824_cov_192.111549_g243_i0.p1  ORF type:complete len:533 (-),score=179.96 NODE_301_length_1824_cov_192.111549_g243_i0:226-1773(-)